ncbi:hypothetical protein [Pantoea sp.]|uniref:hypothetical protein n=1 Tax=Pantoea sp. TaxID=69393 RepID=UPI0029102B9F|nr:hypothetical protein [Pantoea sp.]MDU5474333.1 hypothetical protein [Pantoea sp.]
MSREEALARLKELQTLGDIELAHAYADDVICDLLKSMGYEDVVIEYDKVDKWFA